MKTRTLCLLLAGTMALSLLSGCGGGKTAGDKAEDERNSSAADTGSGGGDAAQDTAPAGDGEPFSLDPRWADLQPGETAVQYHDVFIKSGMTVGEAMDALNHSEDFYLTSPESTALDEEMTRSDDGTMEPNRLYNLLYGHTTIFYIFYLPPPGEPGTTYRLRDCPIYAVYALSSLSDMPPDDVITRAGTLGELRTMDLETIQGVMETALAGTGAELRTGKLTTNGVEVTTYHYGYRRHFSWNGYTLRSAGSEDGFESTAYFEIAIDTGNVHEKGTMYLDSSGFDDVLIWVPDGAAK